MEAELKQAVEGVSTGLASFCLGLNIRIVRIQLLLSHGVLV